MMRKTLTPRLRFRVWHRDGFRCTYCGVSALDTEVVLEVDHIVAVAHGGSSDLDNLTTACKPCNFRKGPRAVGARKPRGTPPLGVLRKGGKPAARLTAQVTVILTPDQDAAIRRLRGEWGDVSLGGVIRRLINEALTTWSECEIPEAKAS